MSSIHQTIVLQDRTSGVLGKIENQAIANARAFMRLDNELKTTQRVMDELAIRGQHNTTMFTNLQNSQQALIRAQDQYATGARNANVATMGLNQSLQQQNNMLPSLITNLISWTAIFKGIKDLIQLSDSYASATARIDSMTTSLEESQKIQEMIYESAQKSRTSYLDLTKTVSKIGANAGQAFNDNIEEVVAFSEILNKQFVLGGATQQEIASATLQLTQALGSGVLRGQELNAVFNASPPIIKSIAKYLDVDIGQIRKMAAEGKITADIVKNAMFASADEVNKKVENMPITFAQAWTKFKNTLEKILQPVLKALSNIADGLDKVFTFLNENQYILWLVAAGIGAIVIPLIAYNTYAMISAVATTILSTAMGKLFIKFALITAAILIVVGVLLYLWNTNDGVAYWMLYAWQALELGFYSVVLGLKTAWYGLQTAIDTICTAIVVIIQNMVNKGIDLVNKLISGLNLIPGVNINTIEKVTFGDKAVESWQRGIDERNADLAKDSQKLLDKAARQNMTREEDVKNRKKIGMNVADGILPDYASMSKALGDVIGNDDAGGKAVKTTTDDKLISDEDIQLLLDVATRDYKLNYQQVTPNITLTFGDIRETADVDNILDELADRLEEIYDGNMEVTPA